MSVTDHKSDKKATTGHGVISAPRLTFNKNGAPEIDFKVTLSFIDDFTLFFTQSQGIIGFTFETNASLIPLFESP